MSVLLLLFVLVFGLNVLPAFAPPTWMLLSFFGLRFPDGDGWSMALVAALAATAGRSVLALFSRRITRSRWMSQAARANLAAVAATIERRRAASSGAFLLFAFSPLPSNALFLAYGLSGAALPLLALPFLVGRFVSYLVAFSGGAAVAERFDLELTGRVSVLYFVVSQLASLALVYLFTRIDWRRSWSERRVRWVA
jgi:uncharacterized membrane protein